LQELCGLGGVLLHTVWPEAERERERERENSPAGRRARCAPVRHLEPLTSRNGAAKRGEHGKMHPGIQMLILSLPLDSGAQPIPGQLGR
jgi:hypothetical protein